jgi:triosephosphate isomerase
MHQKPLIIANWKMNPPTFKEARHLFGVVRKGIKGIKDTEVVICPPFIWLSDLKAVLGRAKGSSRILGAQDCFWEQKGAYTGEISPFMLKDLGCQYVIVGHSERRKHFGETDEMVNKKLKAVLKVGLKPILCVGEEFRDAFDSEGRPLNEMNLVVGEQLEKDLNGISLSRIRNVIIAYEPVWAIGTGLSCSSDEAMKAALFIKKILSKLYHRQVVEQVKILYGGSVNSRNAVDYIQGARMDGLLVGGASLNATEFVKIVEKVAYVGG